MRNQGRRFFLYKGSRRPYTLQSCTAAIGGCRHVLQSRSTQNDKSQLVKNSRFPLSEYSGHEDEQINHVNTSIISFAPVRILRMGAFCCLCGPSSSDGAFHKNFFPFQVAKIASLGLLRRKGGNHHPAPVRREGR